MTLKRITRKSTVDQICDSIKESVVDGTFKPGDKLSSEGELAETFGVNRFTVRLALQKLSTLGLVETRVGEGSFVKSPSMKQYVREMQIFWDKGITIDEIRRLRSLIETDSIVLASERADEEEKQTLGACLETYTSLLNRVVNGETDDALLGDLMKADLAFHFQTVRMSHNRLYIEIYTMIRELIRSHIQTHIDLIRKNAEEGKIHEDTLHRAAYEAIVHSDRQAAEQYARSIAREDTH